MYFLDSIHAITSGVLVLGQADHHREWCVRDSHVIVFSLHSADAFLEQYDINEIIRVDRLRKDLIQQFLFLL